MAGGAETMKEEGGGGGAGGVRDEGVVGVGGSTGMRQGREGGNTRAISRIFQF